MPVAGDDAGLLARVAATFDGYSGEVGVAVSGGSDSVALLHVLAAAGVRVAAVTVNHDLRTEAASEAQFVARLCGALGVPHDVLVWDHGVIAGNLPDAARRARYGMMAAWAAARGIGRVMLGHTADDQAETVLMGLARGAGLDGLCGMRPRWDQGGVRFERQLLDVTRAELRGYLTRAEIGWIDDPTNENTQYQRVRARRALAVLGPLGISVTGLAEVARNLAKARAGLMAALVDAAAGAQDHAGALAMHKATLLGLPDEIARRFVIAALMWVSGAEYAPRADAIRRMRLAVAAGRDATLWGCRIRVSETDIRFTREPRAVAALVCAPDQLWDDRWRVEGPADAGLEVRALGAEGLRACKDWRATGISRDALIVSPAVWRGDVLVAAPLAGFSNGWTARIDAGFVSFIISH